ncbi:MAG: class I SAM-dependent methyltransferase [Myxococcales bacterium]|nr:class I SAM-dependent methyltransferase [Myxococcales bacterium]
MTNTSVDFRRPAEEHLENVGCYLCGADAATPMYGRAPYQVVRCNRCGFVYTTPRLNLAGRNAMYDEAYWRSDSPKDMGYAAYFTERDLYVETFRRRLKGFVNRFVQGPGRVLDIGCAAGFSLEAFREADWDVWGVEVSKSASDFARDEMRLPHIFTGDLGDAGLEPASFDVITMWEVIEHVEDPIATMAKARALLKPDGWFFLSTQNVNAAFPDLVGGQWHHFKYEEHIYHFSPPTIRRALDLAGFEMRHLQARGAGKLVTIDFIVERAGRLHPMLSKILGALPLPRGKAVYVNPMDEMLVAARARPA